MEGGSEGGVALLLEESTCTSATLTGGAVGSAFATCFAYLFLLLNGSIDWGLYFYIVGICTVIGELDKSIISEARASTSSSGRDRLPLVACRSEELRREENLDSCMRVCWTNWSLLACLGGALLSFTTACLLPYTDCVRDAEDSASYVHSLALTSAAPTSASLTLLPAFSRYLGGNLTLYCNWYDPVKSRVALAQLDACHLGRF